MCLASVIGFVFFKSSLAKLLSDPDEARMYGTVISAIHTRSKASPYSELGSQYGRGREGSIEQLTASPAVR